MAKSLVIEDEANIASAFERCLESAGHTCHLAPDGTTGLAAFPQFQPDLVLLDLWLPDMDGLEVCTKLRHARHANIATFSSASIASTPSLPSSHPRPKLRLTFLLSLFPFPPSHHISIIF